MKFYDLIIRTPDDVLTASRSLLAFHSPVLKNIIYPIEEEESEVSEISIMNFPSSITKKVLEILYSCVRTSLFFDDITEVVHLLCFCQTYQIAQLYEDVRHFLYENVNCSNVCKVHDIACELRVTYVQFLCWKIFDNYWYDIFRGTDFLRCRDTTIYRFLIRPSHIPEMYLLLAIIKWARINCPLQNTRNAIQRFISHIQFRRIPRIELHRYVFHLNILQHFEIFALHNDDYAHPLPSPLSSNYDRDNFDVFRYIFLKYNTLLSERIRFLKERDEFLAQFTNYIDMFLIRIHLPFRVLSEEEVQLNLSVKINEIDVSSLEFRKELLNDGLYFHFINPLFLHRCSDVNVKIIVQSVMNRNIMITPNVPYYVCPQDYSDFRDTYDWRKFYIYSFYIYF